MEPELKKRVKSWLGRALSLTRMHRPLLRERGLVLLFHRVDDRLTDDPLTCTSAEFDRWCDFLRRHFEVLSLSQFIDRLAAGQSVGGCAALTFDDGYLDNYATAAPILKRHNLSACFFVATNFIGSEHVPWWDRELPVRLPWMSWDQVRELQRDGFEIGCHTMNHVDLGVVPDDEATVEITGAKQKLAEELALPVRHFSYPYGGRDQVTAACVATVREAGFASCSSAYGGLVENGEDCFRVQRTPISPWFSSPYQMLAEIVLEAHSGAADQPDPF